MRYLLGTCMVVCALIPGVVFAVEATTTEGQATTSHVIETPVRDPEILLLVDNPVVPRLTNLVAHVTFTDFGRIPTPVILTFNIRNSQGENVWTHQEKLSVTLDDVFVKTFVNEPSLGYDDYTLILTAQYGDRNARAFASGFIIAPERPSWLGVAGIIAFISLCAVVLVALADRSLIVRALILISLLWVVLGVYMVVWARVLTGDWLNITLASDLPYACVGVMGLFLSGLAAILFKGYRGRLLLVFGFASIAMAAIIALPYEKFVFLRPDLRTVLATSIVFPPLIAGGSMLIVYGIKRLLIEKRDEEGTLKE